ncbi:MAG: TIGR03943 family protein [Thermostichales cyanobacterium SZTDM-1c_bins_54]
MRGWLEPLALLAWGSLPWYYASQNRLTLLVRQEYVGFVLGGGTVLILLGLGLGLWHWRTLNLGGSLGGVGHRPLLPTGWGAVLVLGVAALGLLVSPRPLSAATALTRGGGNLWQSGRLAPQRFQIVLDPSQRSLIDWVRTLQVFPDPHSYVGQPVQIQGFVIHPPQGQPETFWLARFVIGCCAADAYPVGLPVHWPAAATLPADSWQAVQGRMELGPDGNLWVRAEQVEPIPTPENPYA